MGAKAIQIQARPSAAIRAPARQSSHQAATEPSASAAPSASQGDAIDATTRTVSLVEEWSGKKSQAS